MQSNYAMHEMLLAGDNKQLSREDYVTATKSALRFQNTPQVVSFSTPQLSDLSVAGLVWMRPSKLIFCVQLGRGRHKVGGTRLKVGGLRLENLTLAN